MDDFPPRAGPIQNETEMLGQKLQELSVSIRILISVDVSILFIPIVLALNNVTVPSRIQHQMLPLPHKF